MFLLLLSHFKYIFCCLLQCTLHFGVWYTFSHMQIGIFVIMLLFFTVFSMDYPPILTQYFDNWFSTTLITECELIAFYLCEWCIRHATFEPTCVFDLDYVHIFIANLYNFLWDFPCRYHYNVADSRLRQHVEKGNEDGLYISCVASASSLWALIMDAGTGFTSQVYELSAVFLHKVEIILLFRFIFALFSFLHSSWLYMPMQ